MGKRAFYVDEPKLRFGEDAKFEAPRLGIINWGLFTESPEKIRIGIVSTGETEQKIREFINDSKSKIPSETTNLKQEPNFPGINSNSVWNCSLDIVEEGIKNIHHDKFEALESAPMNKRIGKASQLIANKVMNLANRTPSPDIIFVGLSDYVDKNFGTGVKGSRENFMSKSSSHRGATKKGPQKQIAHYKDGVEEVVEAVDLRRSLKARTLKSDAPTQIIREETLDGKSYQNKASFAWNFWSSQYYKAGGLPWTAPQNDQLTCYIGLKFFEDLTSKENKIAVSQVFGASGDSVVNEGRQGVYRKDGHIYLDSEGAENLMERSILSFQSQNESLPKRVVVHKSGPYSEDEVEEFKDKIRDFGINKFDFLSFQSNKLSRFYRNARNYPVFRGTGFRVDSERFFLHTTGYTPFLDTYEGSKTPSPLYIRKRTGSSSLTKLSKEIMALSKVNWNNSEYSKRIPVTLDFADMIGKILAEREEEEVLENSKFRKFM